MKLPGGQLVLVVVKSDINLVKSDINLEAQEGLDAEKQVLDAKKQSAGRFVAWKCVPKITCSDPVEIQVRDLPVTKLENLFGLGIEEKGCWRKHGKNKDDLFCSEVGADYKTCRPKKWTAFHPSPLPNTNRFKVRICRF